MDRRIWSRLPEHLLDRVLSFLPLKTFLSLRSTCKRFDSLLFSPYFVSKHTLVSSPLLSSFILLSHPQFLKKCCLFNTIKNSWSKTSLSNPMLSRLTFSNLVSSSNGLLCFSDPKLCSFFVCNLLARSSRHVKFPTCPFDFDYLTLVSTSSGYKLFMLSSNNTLVYDSRDQSWQQFESFDRILNQSYNQKGVFYEGCLFFTTPEPFQIVCFDLETGKWKRPTIRLPNGLTFVRLVSDGAHKLYMIGGVGVSGISRSVNLWEMTENGNGLVEVDTLPEMVCRKFVSVCYHNYEHVYCFWHRGFICVCCYTWPEILYYNVSRRIWHWLPKCPSLPDKWSCGFRWFSFEPQVYAHV